MKLTLARLLSGLLTALGAVAGMAQTAAPATNTTAPAPALADSLFADTLVAKGRGVEVKRSQLDTQVISGKADAAARGITLPPTFDAQMLVDLIHLQLLWNKATEADKLKAREQVANALFIQKTNSNLSDEAFQRRLELQLKAQGLTRAQWDQQNEQRAVVRPVLERELNVTIKDEDVRKYYDENPARFEEPERVRVSHILLNTIDPAARRELPPGEKDAKRKKIDEALKRARAGDDFAALVREYSEDAVSRERGGERVFARGRVLPELEAAAFSLALNQISDIVTTANGYHLLKLSERLPARKLEFDRVAGDIREFLKQQAIQKQSPAYLQKLRQEAGVEILDEKLNRLVTAVLATGGAESAKPDSPAGTK